MAGKNSKPKRWPGRPRKHHPLPDGPLRDVASPPGPAAMPNAYGRTLQKHYKGLLRQCGGYQQRSACAYPDIRPTCKPHYEGTPCRYEVRLFLRAFRYWEPAFGPLLAGRIAANEVWEHRLQSILNQYAGEKGLMVEYQSNVLRAHEEQNKMTRYLLAEQRLRMEAAARHKERQDRHGWDEILFVDDEKQLPSPEPEGNENERDAEQSPE